MASSQDDTWRIEGITSMKCVRLITEALQGFWGITEVLVSKELSTSTARFSKFKAAAADSFSLSSSLQVCKLCLVWTRPGDIPTITRLVR